MRNRLSYHPTGIYLRICEPEYMHSSIIKKYSPRLALILRYHAFTGALWLSLGILIGSYFPLDWLYPSCSQLYPTILILSTILICVIILALPYQKTWRPIFLVIAGMCCISYDSFIATTTLQRATQLSERTDTLMVYGRTITPPAPGVHGYVSIVHVDSILSHTIKIKGIPKRIRTNTPTSLDQYSKVILAGCYRPPRKPENPYSFDGIQYSRLSGIYGTFDGICIQLIANTHLGPKFFTFLRRSIEETLNHIANPEYQGLMIACFLGDTTLLTGHLNALFRNAGIYHLIAISGFNVALIAAFLFAILSLLPLGRSIRISITLVGIWLLVPLVGPLPSLMRAVIMCTLVLASYLVQKKSFGINNIGFAAVCWLLMSPLSLFSPGFQLTFGATLGLMLLMPRFTSLCKPLIPTHPFGFVIEFLLASLGTSLCAFAATAPVLLMHFGTVSFFGIVANILVVLLMTFAMNLTFYAILIHPILDFVASLCMQLCSFSLDWIVSIAKLSNAWEFSSVMLSTPRWELIVLWFVAILIAALIPRKKIGYAIIFFLIIATPVGIVLLKPPKHSEDIRLILFKTKTPGLGAIVWPSKTIWLIGTPKSDEASYYYASILAPWLRHQSACRVSAIVTNGISRNLYYDFGSFLSNKCKPHIYIANSPIVDRTGYQGFLAPYGISPEFFDENLRPSPWPGCTLSTFTPSYTSDTVVIQPNPQLYLRLFYHTFIVLADAQSCTNLPAHAIVQSTQHAAKTLPPSIADILIISSVQGSKTKQHGEDAEIARATEVYQQDECGAVDVTITKSGIATVKTMTMGL